MRGFVGFIVYAENSVPGHPNGHFVTENLPPGVEVVDCSNLLVRLYYQCCFTKCTKIKKLEPYVRTSDILRCCDFA